MSVRRRPDRGNRPEVRWKEGGKHPSCLFEKVRDAEAFDREIKRNKQLGTLASSILQSRMTLTDFVRDEWWPKYAIPNLDQSTRDVYAQTWAKHLLPRVGGYELRELTPALVEDLRAQLHSANVGEPTQIKALGILQGICKRAVVRGLIPNNPVLPVDKPRQRTRPQPEPLPPLVVESIRAQLAPADAILVSILAYAGPRPEEALSRTWADVRERTLQVYARQDRGRARVVDLSDAAPPGPRRVAHAVREARHRPRSLSRRETATSGRSTTGTIGESVSTSQPRATLASRATCAHAVSAQVCSLPPMGGSQSYIRRQPGRMQRRNAGTALRRCDR